MTRVSRIRAAALGGSALLALGACSLPGSGPDAGEALDRLAAALAKGSLAGMDLVGDDAAARTAYAAVTEDMGRAKVRAGEVTEKGDTARGVLEWSWPVGAKTWSYETTVELVRSDTSEGQAWLPRWSPSLVEKSLKKGEVLSTTGVKAPRGDILAGDGSPIVTPRPVLRVGLDKSQLDAPAQAPGSAQQLARLVGIDAPAFAKRVAAAGPKAFVQGIVYRREDAPARVLTTLERVPGGRAISDRLPLAPSKDFAPGLLGSVGPATAELVKDSKGRIKAGDDTGLSGLQKRYDEQLSGTRGETVAAVAGAAERRTLFTVEPVPGTPLRTTLDTAAQTLAQSALAGLGPASALVAIQPSTGNLLVAASGPGSNGYNTATFGRYPPGSTFKIVSALALLRSGLRPTSTVECPPTVVVDGKTFKNYDDYPSSGIGRIRLEDALANSCNTAFIGQRDRVKGDGLAQAAAALGLGVDHDTGFPAYFGQVGQARSETQAAASMIGQGTVLASPMAMATVVASVVKGSTVLPTLLPDVPVQQAQPGTPLTASEAEQLRAMMRGVVERGSGTSLQGLPGGPVIAKTGTAEFGDKPPLPTHAWMVAGRDDLAVAVFVERGESGSRTAGPVLRRFLQQVRVP